MTAPVIPEALAVGVEGMAKAQICLLFSLLSDASTQHSTESYLHISLQIMLALQM